MLMSQPEGRATIGIGQDGQQQMTAEVDWQDPSARPVLGANDVHTWRAWLDVEPGDTLAYEGTLAPGELERANRFHFDRDRRRFIVAHGILRRLLGAYLEMSPGHVCFTVGSFGKPALPRM